MDSLDETLQRQGPGFPTELIELVDAIPITVDMLPLRLGATQTINLVQFVPQKLLNRDPRRGYVTVATPPVPGIDICIAKSMEEVVEHRVCWTNTFTTAIIRFASCDELWAMNHAAADCTISVLSEQWTS